MTAGLHKLTAGDGYTYLTRQVAAADSTALGRSSLGDYYLEKGESPGRWRGRGLAALGPLSAGERVTEAQMKALFGEGLHPDATLLTQAQIDAGVPFARATRAGKLGHKFHVYDDTPNDFVIGVARRFQEYNRDRGERRDAAIPPEVRAQIRSEVGRETFEALHERAPLDDRELAGHIARMSRPKNQAVAGYDMTFAPPKSVSALWAVAPREVAETISAAHTAAVEATVQWVEDEVAFTRRGRDGVRQVDIEGLITAQFVHRDSRASDPHLHTHVAISNKVRAVEDGAWLALDGSTLYQATVAASERYDTLLETELAVRLGLEFANQAAVRGKLPTREVVGVTLPLVERWSSRDRDIESRRAALSTEFQARHGRPPTPKEAMVIHEQAWSAGREAKHEPRALADQRRAWRAQAVDVLGSESAIEAMVERAVNVGVEPAGTLSASRADELATQVVRAVEARRSRFHSTHLIAETQRAVRAEGLAPELVQPAVDHIVGRVVGDHAVPISRPDSVLEPAVLRRKDGTSVYKRAHSDLYTTAAIVAAESLVVEAAGRTDGRSMRPEEAAIAILEAQANGTHLNPGQAAMVEELASSGRRVQLALAPAGSGKTTALGVFTAAWESSGGTVFGLAPSAVAAAELRSATGGRADTIASLTWTMEQKGHLPEWAEHVDDRSLIVVDEAGMAGTRDLAAVVEFALGRGASVRLVGDDRQLASIAAGGVLRDIAAEHGAVTLSQLMRFEDTAEAAATLAVRDGQVSALGFYVDRGRVHVHDESTLADEAFALWSADRAEDRDSLMMAHATETVDALNVRARAARLDGVVPDVVAALRRGQEASAGDTVVTRQNNRLLRLSPTDWVKNGDRWTVREVHADGSLTVHHKAAKRLLRLPAEYVAEHVDLGYASTIHGAQGMTVDTAYTVLSGLESRQLLYVALSRGRGGNHLLVSTGGDGDSHKMLTPEHVIPPSATDRLERILATDGAQESARTARRIAEDPAVELARVAGIYRDAAAHLAVLRVGPDRMGALADVAESVAPGVTDAPAWDTLRGHLAMLEADGRDAEGLLRRAATGRELGSAADVAAVLDWRLDPTGEHSSGSGPLPWLPAIAEVLTRDEEWGGYLRDRAAQVEEAAAAVRERVLVADEVDLPAWAHAFVEDRRLVAEVAVWRAARGTPDTDERVLDVARDAAEARYLEGLRRRLAEDVAPVAAQWRPYLQVRCKQVLTDPWWPVLGRRLDVAGRAGFDVQALLKTALDEKPLPDEQPAAALWFRMVGTLAPVAAVSGVSTRLRPDWSPVLLDCLPDGVGPRVMRDPEWPLLVAAVEDAQAQGARPEVVLAGAVAVLGADRIGQPDGVPLSEVAITLAWRVQDVAAHPVADEVLEHELHDAEVEEFLAATAADRDRSSQPAGSGLGASEGSSESRWSVEPPEFDEPASDIRLNNIPADVTPEPTGTSRERIVELHELAATFYAKAYAGSGAARYVAGRFAGDDLSQDDRVTVGYAPAGWTNLTDHLREQGAQDAELVDAGLALYSRRGTPIDQFRDRVVFGLRDANGDLVGFSGRAAPGAGPEVPKYVNTPTTEAFSKGEVLFGLAENRDLLAAGAVPARAEGVLDALAITKAGAGNVVGVAPLGTALTQAQAELIAAAALANTSAERHGLVLEAVDTDAAGTKAAARDFELLTAAGADVRRLVLVDFAEDSEPVKDPADLFARDGGVSLGRVLALPEVAPSLASALIADRIASDRHVVDHSAPGTVALARSVAGMIAVLPPAQWDEHVQAAAALVVDRWPDADRVSEIPHVAALVGEETTAAASGLDPARPVDGPSASERTAGHLAAIRARREAREPAPEAAPAVDRDRAYVSVDAAWVQPDRGFGRDL